jgi:hypothetical protein
MTKNITLTEIINTAQLLDANRFAKYLDENRINWTPLDMNIMDYNDEDFNITLDDYNDENILFIDGEFQA